MAPQTDTILKENNCKIHICVVWTSVIPFGKMPHSKFSYPETNPISAIISTTETTD
jgi:hypothetical protein